MDGSLGIFADNTKDVMAVLMKEYAIKLQQDLVKPNNWSINQNMFLNTDKF